MEYRKMEHIGVETSLLGFGCMRFPTDAEGKIREDQVFDMIDTAYRAGVNYFDTAYPYHDGASEPVTGKALARYPRESYYLATKLPVWEVKGVEDAERIFAEQLRRLDKDYIDFYLLHALNRGRFHKLKEQGILEFGEKLKEQGKIRYFGFSFHDDYEAFAEILQAYPWDFCQIQLNYMDRDSQATTRGVELAESLGIPVIVMEPVKGGSLAGLPENIDAMFRKNRPDDSAASWALRFVGSFENVKVILSGMSNKEQVEDNLKTFDPFEGLTEEEQGIVKNVAKALRERVQNNCTGCRYCMPCPSGVDIPRNFSIWNEYHIYHNTDSTRFQWKKNMPEGAKAKNCVQCGKCEGVCPQNINIRENLARLQEELDRV